MNEKLEQAIFMVSLVPEVILECAWDGIKWLDAKVVDALDVWDD